MAVSNFLIPLCGLLFLCVSAEHKIISTHNLETFYDTVSHHQTTANRQNAKNAPYPSKILNVSQLVQALANKKNFEKGVSLEMITQVYHTFDEKVKYEVGSDSMLEKINFDIINLTVYHRYEEVDGIGKKMPLLFTNLGPPSAVLKKTQPMFLNKSQILCGSAVSRELAACVTSLEEMLKFVFHHMGEKVKPFSAVAGKWQQYTITGMPKVIGHKLIGCHKSDFLQYAVYECHAVPNSVARIVPLLGKDGVKVEAVTICHMDTSAWNPHYISFRLLKAKPGIPVCHFLATDDIIWLTNSPTGTKNL